MTSPLKEVLMKLDAPGVRTICAVCHMQKKPIGRSTPLVNGLCDADCEGYGEDPRPTQLWPGERPSEFGYPCGTVVDPAELALLTELADAAEAWADAVDAQSQSAGYDVARAVKATIDVEVRLRAATRGEKT